MLRFCHQQVGRVCSLSTDSINWSLDNEGWFVGVSRLDTETYVVLHYGDVTMGGDSIYRLVDNRLMDVGGAKCLSSLAQVGSKLYYTSLNLNGMTENNLFCFDLTKNEPATSIGLDGYTYDVVRNVTSSSNSSNVSSNMEGLAVKGDFIYTMLYKEKAKKNNRSVIKIDTMDNSQTILPIEASKFWFVTDGIVYEEYTNGKLMKSDFDGSKAKVLVDQRLDIIKVYKDETYYTVKGKAGLYHLNTQTLAKEKLSDMVADDILINKSGNYFINQSYDAGIFKISGGKVLKMADGFPQEYINTDGGVLYNKRSSTEIYLIK